MNLMAQNPHMPAMPRSNIHLDILEGRDETLDVTDFFSEYFLAILSVLGPHLPAPSDFEPHPTTDIHSDMERKLQM